MKRFVIKANDGEGKPDKRADECCYLRQRDYPRKNLIETNIWISRGK